MQVSAQPGLGLAPLCPSPARLLSSAPRLRWACGGDGEESGVESRRPMFPMGRSPDPRARSSARSCSLRPDLLRVRPQSQRRGAGSVSATRDPDPRLAPCSPPLGAEDRERGCAPSGRGGGRNGWAESGEIRSRGSQGTPAIPSPAALLIFPSWFPHPTFSDPLAAPRPGSQGKVSLKTDATKKLLQTRTF